MSSNKYESNATVSNVAPMTLNDLLGRALYHESPLAATTTTTNTTTCRPPPVTPRLEVSNEDIRHRVLRAIGEIEHIIFRDDDDPSDDGNNDNSNDFESNDDDSSRNA